MVMETFEKVAIIAILLVGVGIVLFFLLPFPFPLPGEGKPEFRAFDFRVIGNSVSMYVENTGSGGAHHVRIEVYGNSSGGWLLLNAFDTSGPSKLEVGDKQIVVLDCAIEPSGHDEYKIVISCDEGVTHELIVGFGS